MVYKPAFGNAMERNLQILVARVAHNKPALIACDGGLGEGKTTLMIHMADYIESLYGNGLINLNPDQCIQYAMGADDFMQKLELCKAARKHVIIYDEAGDFAKGRGMTTFNHSINRAFDMIRTYQMVILLGLPLAFYLDPTIINKGVVRGLIHCYGRDYRGNIKAYNLYRLGFILRYQRDQKITNKMYAYQKVRPNFYDHFTNLDPDRALQLDTLCNAYKTKVFKKSKSTVMGMLDVEQIAQTLGKTVNATRQILFHKGIKPVKKIGKRVFFNNDVMNKLEGRD